ncbi:MAG: FAD-dependent oxidoreductase [Candidatus Nanopelagicaceae bacterium]|nr:FAD-dependent oxidoreductase [Candidatus Nanopelagicaceae bacterium]
MITVIGGGPAGIAAALAAARTGESVRIIEGSSRLGGQYWRHLPEDLYLQDGEEYLRGQRLRQKVSRHPNIEILFNTHLWHANSDENQITLNIVQRGNARMLTSDALILATGAYDRSLPFPGWDIPGVMTAGAAQSLLKGSDVRAGNQVVIAGTGPFLLPVASGLLDAGVEVVGLFEANRISRWVPFAHVGLANISKVALAIKYMKSFKTHGLKMEHGQVVLRANAGSDGLLHSITVTKVDRNFQAKMGSEREIICDALAITWGFTPDVSVASNLGLKLTIDTHDGSTTVVVDEHQQTSLRRVFAAGEITGIGGSELAMTEGEIAGISAAHFLDPSGNAKDEPHIKRLLKMRKSQRNFARALLSVYKVRPGWTDRLTPETVICRCEEVSLTDIQDAVHKLGATNSRSTKLFCRAGMGMCQGRTCLRSVSEIVAKESGVEAKHRDQFSSGYRPIIFPISLDSVANALSVEDSHHNH